MLGNDRHVLSRPPIRKNLTAVLQNCEKPAVKHSIEKSTQHYFVGLSTTFCPRL